MLKNLRANIETYKGILNIDFVISKNNKPAIFIEATRFLHLSRRFSTNFKQRIYQTDYRFLKIKNKFPKSKTIIIINTEANPIIEYRIRNMIKNETMFIDKAFINVKDDKILNEIKSLLSDKNE